MREMPSADPVLAAVTRALGGLLDEEAVDDLVQELLDDAVDLAAARHGFVGELLALELPAPGGGQDAGIRVVASVGEPPSVDVLAHVREVAARGRESLSDTHVLLPLVDADRTVGVLAVGADSHDAGAELVGLLEPFAVTCAMLLRSRRVAGEREASEAALRQERSLLQDVADNSSAVIFVKDTEGRYLLVNRHFEKVVGVVRDQVLGRTDLDILPREVAESLRANDRVVLERGASVEFEEVVPYEGEPRTYTSVKFPLRARDGSAYAVCGIATDVTQSRALQEEVRRQADQLTAILDNSPATIFIKDLEGRYVLGNAAWERLTGVSRSELGDIDDHDIYPPDVAEQFRANDARVVRSGEPVMLGERVVWGNEERVTQTLKFPLRTADGVTYAVCGIATDVTEQRRVEERFRAMAGLVEASTDFVAIGDLHGRTRYVNPAGRRLVGLDGPVEGRQIADFHPAHRREQLEREVLPMLASGKPWSGEFELRHQVTGESIPVMATAFGVSDPESGETVALGTVMRDLREDRRAEAERTRLEQRLAQAQRMESVGRLAGGVAHDFNNLLTVIVNYADLLLSAIDDPALRTEAEQIRTAAEKASTLTRQLLLFSRRTVVKPEVVRPDQVVEGLGHLLRRTLGEDVELRTEYDPDTPNVEIDPAGLEQVVVNLAVNARDAMRDGGTLTIRTRRVRVDASESVDVEGSSGWHAELTVTDTGAGMPVDVAARAFEPFFTTKEPGRGTGLGLASAHGIVEQAGGHVRLDSVEGRGTTVTVLLPAKEPARETPTPAARGARPRGQGETVLVVEDDAGVRTLTVRVLARNGYQVLEAEGPHEALDILAHRQTAPDLLLTDVVMPGMSGTDLADRVLAEYPGMSVVLMSGYPRDALGERLSPDTVLLDKPFTVEGLLAVVRTQLGAA